MTQGFVRQDTNAELFHELVSDHSEVNFGLTKTQSMFQRLLDLNNQLFIGLLLVVGAWRVLQPGSTCEVGDLVGFLFMANLFFSPITGLGVQYNHALTAMAGAERVFDMLDRPTEQHDAADARDVEALAGQVEFRDVTFGYAADRPVLHEIRFVARPGQVVALVGHTGSGKSSIMNLVAKFYLPSTGQVLVDGQDLRLDHVGVATTAFGHRAAAELPVHRQCAGQYPLGPTRRQR